MLACKRTLLYSANLEAAALLLVAALVLVELENVLYLHQAANKQSSSAIDYFG